LSAVLCAATALASSASAQIALDSKPEGSRAVTSSSPAAWVYVSATPTDSSTNVIHAYEADSTGRLSPVPGTPFQENVSSMAVNGSYLFASNANSADVDAYHIEGNGSLTYANTTNVIKFNAGDCGYSGQVFLDHTGATLYDTEFDSDCSNNSYESLQIDKANGSVKALGNANEGRFLYQPASFIGNNVYAYSAACNGNMYWEIFSLKRASNGLLSSANASTPVPTPPAGHFYCPSNVAADPTNHVAITMQPVNQETFSPDLPGQVASYTADASGNLKTTNISADMARTHVGNVYALQMSPSGKLLAVSGSGGLQVLHFNGASPVTEFTPLLTTDEVDQMFWDNQNHLYAISRTAGRLYVYTVTPAGYAQAPGSPYAVVQPQSIIVQPLPLPWE
jgi:hypothetical protein